MKRYINYLIILVIVLFGGISRVEAATEMLCKYARKDVVVYMYGTGSNVDVVTLRKNGSKYIFTKGVINKIKYDNGSSKCPSYLDGDSGENYKAGTGFWGNNYDLVEEDVIYSPSKVAWNKVVNVDSISLGEVKVELNYNSFGFFDFSLSSGDEIVIYNYKDGVAPSYLCKTSADEQGVISFDNEECGNKLFLESVDVVVPDDDNSNSLSQEDSSSVVLPEEENVLGVGKYCLYKNLGHCSGDDGDINGDCGAFSNEEAGKMSSYFVRSPYAIMKYNTSSLAGVYLPKSVSSNKGAYVVDEDKFSNFTSIYNSFDGSKSQLNSMVVNYFDYYPAAQISILQSADVSEEVKDGCPTWFVETSGAGGQDYEDNMYFYQYYNTNAEDNSNSEDPGIADSGVDVDILDGPYYCVYKIGSSEFALKYTEDRKKLYLLPGNIENLYHSYVCNFDDCSVVDGISFVGYGGNESNYNKAFQNDFVAGICPAQLNYTNGILTLCKNESSDCVNGDAGIFSDDVRFTNSWSYDSEKTTTSFGDINECSDLISDELSDTLNEYMNIIRVVIPIILIVLGTVDFGSAVFSSNEDGMKKAQGKFVKRLIAAVVIFLLPTFVNLLLDIANTVWGWNAGISC